jgi:hypothetical protein
MLEWIISRRKKTGRPRVRWMKGVQDAMAGSGRKTVNGYKRMETGKQRNISNVKKLISLSHSLTHTCTYAHTHIHTHMHALSLTKGSKGANCCHCNAETEVASQNIGPNIGCTACRTDSSKEHAKLHSN